VKNLFDRNDAEEIRQRIERLRPDSPRQWGKMAPAQMAAHCANGLEMALGKIKPPRMFIGRLLGSIGKRMTLRDDKPIPRNSPTSPHLLISDAREFDREQVRLRDAFERFVSGGPAACTAHPHDFFGRLTADEWAALMYKHLDHHLRQFGL
jgi:hypothetical protein